MRTGLFLLAGLFLFAASLILGKLFGEQFPAARTWAFGLAVGLWLVLTACNMWLGVSKAGYTVRDELPIFLLLFAVTTATAILARRWIA